MDWYCVQEQNGKAHHSKLPDPIGKERTNSGSSYVSLYVNFPPTVINWIMVLLGALPWKGTVIAFLAAGELLSSPGSTFCADSYFSIWFIPPRYRWCTYKILVILPKVQVAGYSYTHMPPAYVALNSDSRLGAWLYGVRRTCAKTAAVSHGASRVTTYALCNHFSGYSESTV